MNSHFANNQSLALYCQRASTCFFPITDTLPRAPLYIYIYTRFQKRYNEIHTPFVFSTMCLFLMRKEKVYTFHVNFLIAIYLYLYIIALQTLAADSIVINLCRVFPHYQLACHIHFRF